MTRDAALDDLAALCGILPTFRDLQGLDRPTSHDTQRALLAAGGVQVDNVAAVRDSLAQLQAEQAARQYPREIITQSGQVQTHPFGPQSTWQLRAEGQEQVLAEGQTDGQITLPALEPGIYVLTAQHATGSEDITILAAPPSLPQVSELTGHDRLWGLTLALYGLQSGRNSGLGDYADLAQVTAAAARHGAGFVGINPVHNMGFANAQAFSPYSPSHRGFLNTSYIALDQIPGLADGIDLRDFATLRAAPEVPYHAHKPAHNAGLEALCDVFTKVATPEARSGFEQFKQQRGDQLRDFARYEATSEINGPDWREWPANPAQPSAERIEFHMWLQWVADSQLAQASSRAHAAGLPLGLYLDLAVGPRRDGAESWTEQATIAQGVSLGAPPDHLSPAGQNWNLAAFAPARLRAHRYGPLRRIMAQTMRHAGIIRIDHVLGLNRSFWVPDSGCAGGYIRQPFESLLAVIKIEAARHNCAVIGEDLGLVPEGFRDTMRSHGFYGYSVLQYEKDKHGRFRDPQSGSAQVLSCFATHDTPTIKGYQIGRDIDWWQHLDWVDEHKARDLHRQRASEVAAFSADRDFPTKAHQHLAGSNATLVAVQLDDALGITEAQNLPGTIDEHPNWRRKYTVPLEQLADDPGLGDIAALMQTAGRSTSQKEHAHEDQHGENPAD